MSIDLQTRLLRVLSDRRFYRVGGQKLIGVDVRVIAASNLDLEKEVAAGRFREDLYHRLNVFRIDLPSLSERIEDVPLLCAQFLKTSAQELQVEERKELSNEALEKMMLYHWPGNVRQLENACRWINVMAPTNVVKVEDLPIEIRRNTHIEQEHDWEVALAKLVQRKLNMGQSGILEELLRRFESTLLREALDHTGGHRQNAAKLLGWGRNTLTRKLRKL
jgi:two-component system nitrogen regulation response regulator GlnG